MRNILSLSILASALAFGATAFATEPMPTSDPTLQTEITPTYEVPTFESLDTNQDGRISKSEIPVDHELNTLFANFDSNSDDFLSRTEFDMYAEEDEEEAE